MTTKKKTRQQKLLNYGETAVVKVTGATVTVIRTQRDTKGLYYVVKDEQGHCHEVDPDQLEDA